MIAYEPRGPVTEVDVRRLEERLELRLPDDHRTWLRANDGARLDPLGVRGFVVNSFVGVLDTHGGDGLAQLQDARPGGFAASVPAEWLVVSHGPEAPSA